jgi:hypothetical protein
MSDVHKVPIRASRVISGLGTLVKPRVSLGFGRRGSRFRQKDPTVEDGCQVDGASVGFGFGRVVVSRANVHADEHVDAVVVLDHPSCVSGVVVSLGLANSVRRK